jgi:alpha-N-arabinofuranosidase
MEPVVGVYAGFGLRGVVRIAPGASLKPYVDEALEEIEFVTGDASTPWGARRAKDGHPAPFPLQYVEVGNENFFDREPGSYDGRFAQCSRILRLMADVLSDTGTV